MKALPDRRTQHHGDLPAHSRLPADLTRRLRGGTMILLWRKLPSLLL